MSQLKENNAIIPEVFKNFRSTLKIASPGRINLIGEHTDYNNGFVLPTAIDKRIYFEFSVNSSEYLCNVFSENLQASLQFDLREIKVSDISWHNYILGVVAEIQKRGKTLRGFNCIINSDLPFGAGVSSSAALECGIATGLNTLFDLELSKMEIVELSMSAEHNYVGAKCGIMDQFASVMSKKNSLIYLDCKNIEATFIPANFRNCKILLLNTMVSHKLADSEYNTRRKQCEEVVRIIQEKYPEVASLRDVNKDILDQFKAVLPKLLLQRASYVLEENQRVGEAVNAMKDGDLDQFGKLMYLSHEGLKNKYEVSCPELDFLVEYARKQEYIYGSRMMGGGFGGCTINIIEENKVDIYTAEVSQAYFEKFGIELKAISVLPSEGTKVVKKEE